MKKLKNIIIALIILILIMAIMLFVLLSKNDNTKENKLEQEQVASELNSYEEGIANPNLIINGSSPKLTISENIYFTINNCLQEYIDYYRNNKYDALYAILSKEFIENEKISVNNVQEKITKIPAEGKLKILELYEIGGALTSYYEVKANIGEAEYYFHIDIDGETKTFDIKEYSKSDYDIAIKRVVQTTESQEKKIELNEYNKVKYSTLSEEEIANIYLQDYVQNALYNTQKAYETLNYEYKKARFKTYEDFQNYVNENKLTLQGLDSNNRKKYSDFNSYEEYEQYIKNLNIIELDKYSIENNVGYKIYTCVDDCENYYIFKVYNAMNYEVTLDNYTIETESFKNQYTALSNEEKVMVNIDKFIKMINTKNYETSYNKLDETFRNNNFGSLENYKKYIKENFYEYNKIDFIKVTVQENTYLYEVKLTDITVAKSKEITKTFVMQLKSGTDFVMSFNIN